MGFVNTIFIYLLVWWCVLFTVLPLGVERHTDTGKGHDAGAPKNADLPRKLKLTSLISAVIVGGMWLLVHFNIITWGEWFRVKT
jgi:predicted secreted protein